MKSLKQFANLSRTIRLLRSFPQEQKNPPLFYIPLAEDTLSLVKLFHEHYRYSGTQSKIDEPVQEKPSILDVGGGPGFFSRVFAEAGWHYTSVDVDAGDFEKYGYSSQQSDDAGITPIHIRASGDNLPFQDDSFEAVLCSNVAEHVSRPWELAEELLRVVRPGGLLFFSYTIWYGPFGGHETGPWHYLGGNYAARHYQKKHGTSPKNHYGTSLFRVDTKAGLQWVQRILEQDKAKIVQLFPRYHPWWAWWIISIPGLRELFTSNLMMVLVKTET